MKEDRDERTIKEIIEYLKKQNGNCSNELSNVEGLCLVNYIEWLEKEKDRLGKLFYERNEENIRLNNIINTMLEFNLFAEECPLNFGYTEKCDEEKAQDVFYENDYCEENCNDDYKKCWLKYFKRLQELKGSDSMVDRKELKIGYYCRTKDGYIAKLIDYGFNRNVIGKCLTFDSIIRNEKYKTTLFDSEIDEYITKIGKTIGDVAEVGDIAYMFAGLPIFKKLTHGDKIGRAHV